MPSRAKSLSPFLAFLFLAPLPAQAQAQVLDGVDLSRPLESSGRSARALGMGSAFTAVEGDGSCVFFNPAGLARLRNPQITLFHHSAPAGISQQTLLAAYPAPVEGAGSLAFALNHASYGSLEGYDYNGAPTGPYKAARTSVMLGWGCPFSPDVAMGLGLRESSQTIPGWNHSTLTLDLGTQARLFRELRLGGAFSFQMGEDNVAAGIGVIRTGLSYTLNPGGAQSTLLAADYYQPAHGAFYLQAGLEQSLRGKFLTRVGWRSTGRENFQEGFKGLTAGLGLRLNGLELDYAYLPEGDWGSSQFFTLGYRFNTREKPLPLNAAPTPTPIPLGFKPPSEISPEDRAIPLELEFELSSPSPGVPGESLPAWLENAIKAAELNMQRNPKDPSTWTALGRLYWQAGRAPYAVQCFEEALRLDPGAQGLKAWLEAYRKAHPQNP